MPLAGISRRQGGIELATAADFDAITGKGVQGTVAGRKVLICNARLLADNNIDIGAIVASTDKRQTRGETVMLAAVDGKIAGLVAVADPIKESTGEAVRILHAAGLRIIMLTGDNEKTTQAVAQQLGIDEVHAGALPADKYALVVKLQSEGRKVAMAGDSVNDAPALAKADVGIAKAQRLSAQSMRNIRQDLFFAFIYNGAGVPIAAGVLYPLFGTLLSPILAAAMRFRSSPTRYACATRSSNLSRIPAWRLDSGLGYRVYITDSY